MKYHPEIDGLRAFAVLSVVIFHVFPSSLSGGFIGVDVFFVISGYLITRTIFEALDNETFSFVGFFGRRIRRIFPALILVMGASLILGWFVLFPEEYAQLGKHIASGSAFVLNFILVDESGYFDTAAAMKPMLHLWSLAVEEQFYIVWPIALILAWKRKLHLLKLTLIIALLSFALNLNFTNEKPPYAFFWPFGRFWELLSGSILAWLQLYEQKRLSNAKLWLDRNIARVIYPLKFNDDSITLNSLSLLGFVFLLFGVIRINEGLGFPGNWALVPVLGAIFIISAGSEARLNRMFLMNPLAIWFGLISYPLYLWHWPLLSFAHIIEDQTPHLIILIAVLIISVILAWATYEFIEIYIRKPSHRIYKNYTLVGSVFVIAISGFGIFQSDGVTSRESIAELKKLNEIIKTPQLQGDYFECKEYLPSLNLSSFKKHHCKVLQPVTPDILFIGDSHTGHFSTSLKNHRTTQNIAIIKGNSCLPFSSKKYFSRKDCQKKFKALTTFLRNDNSIRIIVLSAFWNKAISSRVGAKGDRWRLAAEPTDIEISSFHENMKLFLAAARVGDRKIIFLKDVPHLNFNIRECFNYRPVGRLMNEGLNHNCIIERSELKERNHVFDTVISDALSFHDDILVFNTRELMCSKALCNTKENGLPLYFNGDHVNYLGANKIIIPLLKSDYLKLND